MEVVTAGNGVFQAHTTQSQRKTGLILSTVHTV